MCNDCIAMTLIIHISAHLQVLTISVDSITSQRDFRKCIQYHQLILKCNNFAFFYNNPPQYFNFCCFSLIHFRITSLTEELFSTSVWLQFFSTCVVIAVTMFSITLRSSFSFADLVLYLFVFCIMVDLFIYCWAGQMVTNSNDSVHYIGFNKWNEVSEKSYAKDFVLFIAMAQQPIKLTGGGILPLSMETFSQVK